MGLLPLQEQNDAGIRYTLFEKPFLRMLKILESRVFRQTRKVELLLMLLYPHHYMV